MSIQDDWFKELAQTPRHSTQKKETLARVKAAYSPKPLGYKTYGIALSIAVLLFLVLSLPPLMHEQERFGGPIVEKPNISPSTGVKDVINNLVIGMTQEKLVSLFGENNGEYIDPLSGTKGWRYDFNSSEGYLPNPSVDGEADVIAIKNGQLDMQLFISWEEDGSASHFSLLYRGDENELRHYQLFADGGERDLAEGESLSQAEPHFPNEVTNVINQLQIGMSKDQLLYLFGNKDSEFLDPLNGGEGWRFDFLSSEDYVVNMNGLEDSADFPGIKSGDIALQLFVYWDDTGHAEQLSIIYKGTDAKMKNYRLFQDGGERVQELDD